MHLWLTFAVLALAGVAALVVLVLLARDEPAEDRTFVLLAAVELVLLVQAVAGGFALAGTTREVAGVTFVSYLVSILLALPIGVFWSLAERTRAGTAVLLVAVLTVVALEVRLVSIWSAGG